MATEIYLEGLRAYLDGEQAYQNPYNEPSAESYTWRKGWAIGYERDKEKESLKIACILH